MRGKKINTKAMLTIAPWIMHRHRDHWEKPDQFCPHRFDDKNQKETIKNNYLPFSKGARVCIGKGFATQEAVLTLAEIVRTYKLEYTQGKPPEPISRVTTRPKDGMPLTLTKL